ncbi:helix-turn-helix domain-containing protein [Streptomyces inhibens]|uniref:helix-turn-helix domain-containing protein n=1 Tax=Streptomyces inhibens TaxID=2293571 RepID=UPI0036B59FFD
MTTLGPSLGALLRGRRHAAGMTLEELADGAGVSARAIGDIERGRSRGPQAGTMEAIAAALGLAGAERTELLAAARAGRRRLKDPAPGLCGLPPDIPDFVGRLRETRWLTRTADSVDRQQIAVVSGAPGLGKSALAVHAAWQMTERCVDGCFFIDLRGLDAEPAPPHYVLLRLLKALGVRTKDIPTDTDERQSLYRKLMRDKRALVVLDNAAHEAQVRPLLPGAGAGTVWVTSRRALTGIEHARRLQLEPLSAASATDMLGAIIGTRDEGVPTHVDDTALSEIAEQCGHLPLALRIAGNRLLSRPAWSARELADRLAAEELRLDRLTAGDLHIQSAFTLSHAQLTPELKLLFRRLALVPGPDFGSALGAALTGLPLHRTEQLLDELVELGLLIPAMGDRAAFHDLIRLYATKRLHDEESAEDIRSARCRMNDWLLDTARVAGQWFQPARGGPSDTSAASAGPDSRHAAREWLEDEADNWFTAFRQAAREGRHRTVVDVADSLYWFSHWWLFWGHWPEVFALAYAAARELGDPHMQAAQLNHLASSLQLCLGDSAGSELRALQAETLARQTGNKSQQGWALVHAAHAVATRGRLDEALSYADQAAELFEDVDDKAGRLQALLGTAHDLLALDRPHEALDRLRHILALVTDPSSAPDRHLADYIEANTLRAIGMTHARLGDWAQAASAYRRALAAGPGVPIPNLQGLTLHGLAQALHHQQEFEQARTVLAEARDLFAAAGNVAKAAEAEQLLNTWRTDQQA